MWILLGLFVIAVAVASLVMHRPKCHDCGLKMVENYSKRDGAYYECPHCGDTITLK